MKFKIMVRTLDGGFHQFERECESSFFAYDFAQERYPLAYIAVRVA